MSNVNNLNNAKHNHFDCRASVYHLKCVATLLTNVQHQSSLEPRVSLYPGDSLCVLTHKKVAFGRSGHKHTTSSTGQSADHYVVLSTNGVPNCVWLTAALSPTCTHKHRCSPSVTPLSSAHTNKAARCDLARFGVKRHRNGSYVDLACSWSRDLYTWVPTTIRSSRATLMSS